MSREGFAQITKKPEPAPKPVFYPHQPEKVSKEVIEKEALALFSGTKTLMELTYKYGSTVLDEIIKRNNQLNTEGEYNIEQDKKSNLEIPDIHEIQKTLSEFKKIPHEDEAEEKFIQLLNQLKKDFTFMQIYEPYKLLIKENPDMTDVYEAKAIQDFIEINGELIKE